MAQKIVYVCSECGASFPKWSGRCSECGSWSTLNEEAIQARSSSAKNRTKPSATQTLDSIDTSQTGERIDTGINEVNQVLGGGIVPGSLTLVAGEPGIGKSTLLLQVASEIAASNKVLYVSGEESLQQVKLRATRLQLNPDGLELLSSTDADSIATTIGAGDYDFVIVDSIQTMSTEQVGANPGTVSQITSSSHILQQVAKSSGCAVLIVGHVTKTGNIAGPKVLEHLVDTVLHLEGERFGGFKLLRGVKNRFGSTNEVGVFEMQEKGLIAVDNPSARFLQERQSGSGSVVFAAMEGTRALMVEVQALVNTSPFGYPKRTSVGFDGNRLNVLIAVLSQHGGVNLADKDVYVNVVGGMKLSEPAADLAVVMAIASSAKQKPLKTKSVVFGEVGLSGEVRSISFTEARIKEAKRMKFKTAVGPNYDDAFVAPATNIREAITKAL